MKNLNALFALGFALFLCAPVFGQSKCLSHEMLLQQLNDDPTMADRINDIETHTNNFINQEATMRSAGVVYTIPVVFHVVYNGSSENIPDNALMSQLDVINEDFRRTNADASLTSPGFVGVAADTEIEFCLASVDPNGNPTTGITRTPTTNSSFSAFSNNVKKTSSGGIDPWPTNEYLNVWICDIGGGIIGYAQFPGGPAATDGVVNDVAYTGRVGWAGGPFSPYNLGRTLTHEIGHWLNLRHIWGDGGCSADDFVADTPISNGANYGCAVGSVSCSTVDMAENYMDYTDDDCMNMFSAGQATRMRATLTSGGSRSSVANNAAVVCSGSASCDVPLNPLFTIVSAPTTGTTSWDAVSGATSYELQGRRLGVASWTDVAVSGTSRTFSIFKANKTYEWRVRSKCGSTVSGYTSSQVFTMPPSRIGEFGAELTVYPNPASEQMQVNLNIPNGASEIEISVMDLTGRVLSAETVAVDNGSYTVSYDVASYNNGTYIIQVIAGSERMIDKFVVQH